MSAKIRIGLVGCGVVGTGVLEILREHGELIASRLGASIEVVKIAVRDLERDRGPNAPRSCLTDDPLALTGHPEVDVIVELMGGLHPAEEVVRAALEEGKHVVTANKALLAERGDALFDLARQRGLDLQFEAAVAGGIPIIRTLQEALAADEIQSIRGIINGTSNYILTEMADGGVDFEVALRAAQEAGYAEADPTLDVGGGDAAHKLAILATLAFGVRVHPEHITTEGIDVVDASDINYANGFDFAIRPLAIAARSNGTLDLRVHPALVPFEDPLANVTGALNAVSVQAERVGTCLLSGPGAGSAPTALSVVSDIIDIGRNMLRDASGRVPSFIHDENAEPVVQAIDDLLCRHYLRFTVRDEPGVLSAITGKLSDFGVSIEQMFQNVEQDGRDAAIVVMFTHEAEEGAVREALREIDAMPHTLAPTRLLRIID